MHTPNDEFIQMMESSDQPRQILKALFNFNSQNLLHLIVMISEIIRHRDCNPTCEFKKKLEEYINAKSH